MKQFNPNEFYLIAKHLSKIDCEGAKRTSISRYYYSLFHQTFYMVVYKDYYPTKSSKEHSRISKILQKSDNENEKELGIIIQKLRENRNIADYNTTKINNNLLYDTWYLYDKAYRLVDILNKNPIIKI